MAGGPQRPVVAGGKWSLAWAIAFMFVAAIFIGVTAVALWV